MKFAVGYQLPENNESMPDIIRDYKEHISELYFPGLAAQVAGLHWAVNMARLTGGYRKGWSAN